MRQTLLRGCALAVLLLSTALAFAATYRVKADAAGAPHDGSTWDHAFLTVQAAINAASSGDEVWVAQGTYHERVTTKGGLALLGGYARTGAAADARNWTSYVTTLDGDLGGSVIPVPGGVSSLTVIEGFTITRGSGIAPLGFTIYGGGIYINDSSSPRHSLLHLPEQHPQHDGGAPHPGRGHSRGLDGLAGNRTQHVHRHSALYGGAVFAGNGHPTIRFNTFDGNAGGAGGAVSLPTDNSSNVVGNVFRNNTAINGGGALYCDVQSEPDIIGNLFEGNACMSVGGAIDTDITGLGNPCRIVSNVFRDNRGTLGDAIYATGLVHILNNTFYTNHGYTAGVSVGAVYFYTVNRAHNNIFQDNEVAIGYYHGLSGAGADRLHSNCLFSNDANYNDYAPNILGSNGNFEGDPKLHAPSTGDCHLTSASPCIDAGDADCILGADVDMDQQDRDVGGGVDIGADELHLVLALSTQPGTGKKGLPLTTQPVVAVQDPGGATWTGGAGSATLAITPGTGTPGAALAGTTVPIVNGIAASPTSA